MKLEVAKCFCVTVLLSAFMLGQQQPVSPGAPGSSPVPSNLVDKSPSDALNEHLPNWLRFSGEIRLRGEGFSGAGFKPDDSDGYLLTRLRLNMRVQPASWLHFFFQGQDAHILGENEKLIAPLPPYQDAFDLRQGYVELGNVEDKRRAGRSWLLAQNGCWAMPTG